MSDDAGDRTEQPTERRRTQAREQGNIAKSSDLTAALLLLTGTGAMQFAGPELYETLADLMHASFSAPPWLRFDLETWMRFNWTLLGLLAAAVLPFLLLMMVGGVVSNIVQVGFLWAPEVLMPKWERLSPYSGLQRIFSMQSVARLGGSLAKLIVLAAVAYGYLSLHLAGFKQTAAMDVSVMLMHYGHSLVELAFYLSLSLVVLAVFDYGFQFRMRRRDAHRKLADARQLKDVAKADVVITNPTHIAVAIQYDPAKMPAPVVVAKGLGEIAAQIRLIAAEHGVPIIERKPLARALYRQVRIGSVIPADMYDVFVEILAYVYRVTGRKPPVA